MTRKPSKKTVGLSLLSLIPAGGGGWMFNELQALKNHTDQQQQATIDSLKIIVQLLVSRDIQHSSDSPMPIYVKLDNLSPSQVQEAYYKVH